MERRGEDEEEKKGRDEMTREGMVLKSLFLQTDFLYLMFSTGLCVQ